MICICQVSNPGRKKIRRPHKRSISFFLDTLRFPFKTPAQVTNHQTKNFSLARFIAFLIASLALMALRAKAQNLALNLSINTSNKVAVNSSVVYTIIVTNLTMVQKTTKDGQVVVYVVDRKSGAQMPALLGSSF